MSDPETESDPQRLGGELLASARRDAPSAASRARVAGALGLGVGAAATTATAKAAAVAKATSSSAATAKIAGIGLWTKVVGVAAVTLAVGGTAAVATRSEAPRPVLAASTAEPLATAAIDSARMRHDEIPPPEPAEARVEAAASTTRPADSASAAATARPRPAVASRPPASASDTEPSPLAREVRAIDVARRALSAGDARAALSTLDQHDRDFPNGPMRTEAEVLRVDALVASGDQAAARRLASQLLARDPAGAHARHLRSVVGAAEK